MDPETLARAGEILARHPVVDAHFDLAPELAFARERGARQVTRDRFLPDFRTGGVDLVVSSIFIESYLLPEMGLRRALDQIAQLRRDIGESGGELAPCVSPGEALAARQAGKVAVALSLEGADPIGSDPCLLDIFYALGVRGLGLAWSRRNAACDGAWFAPVEEGRRGGLTAFGVGLCRAAWEMGMWLDVSHLNDEGFADLINIQAGPVMASHSNCRALCPSPRNLTDEQIRQLAQGGGLICVNNIAPFVATGWRERRLGPDDLINHVDHLANLVGVEHVGLGLDFLDAFPDYLSLGEAVKTYDTLGSHAGLADFTAGLLSRGYAEADIAAILGGNFLDFFTRAVGGATGQA